MKPSAPRSVLTLLGAAAALLAIALPAAPAAAVRADVDDFRFSGYDAELELERLPDGRAQLTTTARYTAEFPEIDQNRGIRVLIPERYQGRPTSLRVVAVEDGEGRPRDFEEDDDDDIRSVTIRGEDYVHGTQEYVVTTVQEDVLLEVPDEGRQELYWDLNGDGWAQPFDRVRATVTLPEGVPVEAVRCYRGNAAASAECAAETEELDDGRTLVRVDEAELGPGETATIAIGMPEGSFAQRDASPFASPLGVLQLVAGALALLGAGLALRARLGPLRDAPGRPVVVAEYAPPRGLSPFRAALFLGKGSKAPTALLLGLAVAGVLRLVEVTGGRKPSYRAEILGGAVPAGWEEDTRAVLGGDPRPGESLDLGDRSGAFAKRVGRLMTTQSGVPREAGWRRSYPAGGVVASLGSAVLGGILSFVLGAILLDELRGAPHVVALMIAGPLLLVGAGVLVAKTPLSAEGAELRDHLRGLELYIRMAEQDRIRVLQSPEGAERRPIAAEDRARVLHLHEALLPYAVLFGQERRWAEVLGEHYGEAPPSWYHGTGPFHAAAFASGVGSLSSSVTSSVAATISASSSSGGSSGGGSAGGGGGGGGGGGV
ncbi:DUF2207 family protein [Homoserinibacter sp. YIM 151385]|uniref:DUF2207 family protein n=1 Tax=Homoserinibacter sp. YIM 151385 TaxID=2985506 RepID=UPI0022F00FFC|nr:DUF2207 domain-containing protein [Homoserinibacter sp. YIM 151385]WBU38348.1 DUF2207 domain-containing protein [Homoserinibacter sp. YIM 151385]